MVIVIVVLAVLAALALIAFAVWAHQYTKVGPNEVLIISGQRTLPPELRNARIHRLELPQGRFERRIALPLGRYAISRFVMDGCVALRLAKS